MKQKYTKSNAVSKGGGEREKSLHPGLQLAEWLQQTFDGADGNVGGLRSRVLRRGKLCHVFLVRLLCLLHEIQKPTRTAVVRVRVALDDHFSDLRRGRVPGLRRVPTFVRAVLRAV